MIYVGIDVAKLKLDVCFDAHQVQKAKQKKKFEVFPNTDEGIDDLCLRLPKDAFVIFESTGPYSKLLYKKLCEKEIRCCCANPYQVLQFVRATGKRTKTDKVDAHSLALYGEKMEPKQTQFAGEKNVELQELVRAREVLMDEIRAHKNRTDVPYVSDYVNKLYSDLIESLEEKLKQINQKINEFMLENDEFSEKLERLCTLKGVACTIAASLLAYCPELGTLSSKQVGALAGVVPYTKESGTTYMQEHIGGGRPRFRRALYMAAQVAVRYDPEMHAVYNRLITKGKTHKIAIVAVMRRLADRANSILKRRVNYEVRGELPLKVKKVA